MSGLLGAWIPTESTYGLVVTAGGSTETLVLSVTAGRTYWVSGDGQADDSAGDADLLALLEAVLDTHSQLSGSALTLIAGRVVGSSSVTVEWSSSSTTFPGWVLGFGAADAALDAAGPCPLVWLPGDFICDDSRDRRRHLEGHRESMSGLVYGSSWGEQAALREIGWRLIHQERILAEYAGPAAFNPWEEFRARAKRVRVYEDETDLTGGTGTGYRTYSIAGKPKADRNGSYGWLWDVSLRLVVAGTATAQTLPDIFVGATYLWSAEDAADGAAWVDQRRGASLAWQGSGVTVTPGQATDGLDDAAIGASRVNQAVRVTGGTATDAWSGAVASLVQSAGQPILVRALVRHADPDIDGSTHGRLCNIQDSTVTSGYEIVRVEQYNSANAVGGLSVSYSAGENGSGSANTAASPSGSVWTLHDVHIAGDGTIQAASNGRGVSNATGAAMPAMEACVVSIGRYVETDIVAIAIYLGDAAASWTPAGHDADVVRLPGVVPS